jgi:hypothetical protein
MLNQSRANTDFGEFLNSKRKIIEIIFLNSQANCLFVFYTKSTEHQEGGELL